MKISKYIDAKSHHVTCHNRSVISGQHSVTSAHVMIMFTSLCKGKSKTKYKNAGENKGSIDFNTQLRRCFERLLQFLLTNTSGARVGIILLRETALTDAVIAAREAIFSSA